MTQSTNRVIYETEDFRVELQEWLDSRHPAGRDLVYALVNKRTGVTEARAQTEGIARRATLELQQDLNMILSGQQDSPGKTESGLPPFMI